MILNNDIELAQLTLREIHKTPSGHKLSLCEEVTSNVSP